jgi:hypothetical protein
MAVMHARSGAEVREYLTLAMDDCDGAVGVEHGDLFEHDGRWGQTFVARCLSSGVTRDFAFTIDPPPADADPDLIAAGSQPSELIDAGQWYLIFARYGEEARAAQQAFAAGRQDVPTAEQLVSGYANARAALVEVLKFIPPGTDTPPDTAYWTDLGRQVRDQYPQQLRRPALEPVVTGLAELLQEFRDATDQALRDAGS